MNKKSNKLISLLSTLDRSDAKAAQLFLASPYFNKSEDLQRLFAELFRRLSKDQSLQKEKIWEQLWPRKKYNDVRFRKFCSDLLKLLEEFLVQEELKKRSPDREQLYLRAINRKSPKKLIESLVRNWDKYTEDLADEMPEASEKYLNLHKLEKELFDIAGYDRRTFDRSNLEEVIRNLDVFYLSEKLKSYNSSNSTAYSRDHKYEILFVPQIIDFINTHEKYLDYLPVAIHYYNYRMEAEPSVDEHYQQFRTSLFEHSKYLPIQELQELFQVALNYSSRKINRGNKDYLKEYLDVYRTALEKEAVFEDGYLDPLQFKNTILIALRYGDFAWTQDYIANYQNRIAQEFRVNAVNYNSATLYFYQKDYERALDYLRDVEYENITYNLNAKAMLLAIYYETDEFDALDSLFDAILAYLSRHKEIPDQPKKAFRSLVSLTRKLTRVIPGDKNSINKMLKEIEQTPRPIASLNWLNEKVAELS